MTAMLTAQARAESLLAEIRQSIPLSAAMAVRVVEASAEHLVLGVPLPPNQNDKGTAFAGSIASLATLTGWAALMLWAEANVAPCQVAVYDSHLRYRTPITGDFQARVRLPDTANLERMLRGKGRGKIGLEVDVADASGVAVTLHAHYAVWLNRG